MTIEQIKLKTIYGDYTTLGKMLGITSQAAKMRFLRGDQEASEKLQKIIETRENLLSQSTNSINQ